MQCTMACPINLMDCILGRTVVRTTVSLVPQMFFHGAPREHHGILHGAPPRVENSNTAVFTMGRTTVFTMGYIMGCTIY